MKSKIFFFTILAAICLLCSACQIEFEGPLLNSGVFHVGSTGPAGGYIFYDKGYYSEGWRYLEAACEGWSGYREDPYYIFGHAVHTCITETSIGSGTANTNALVFTMGKRAYLDATYREYTDNYAVKICADYSMVRDGIIYDDWFLPSKDELFLMWRNLAAQQLGGFSLYYYLSSSESSYNEAWSQFFVDHFVDRDYRSSQNRSFMGRVRPVRAF